MAANVHHLRWLLPTPRRLLAVLLGVEGFLWLSERFQWFPFNHHKGWTVLIAVAAVGVFLLLMLLWFLLALVLRLRFQFSVRSLLMLPLLVVLPGSWLAAERREAEQQRDAIAGIRALGGGVVYDYEWTGCTRPPTPPGPAWARGLFGVDFFADVARVTGAREPPPVSESPWHQFAPITDEWLGPIGKLSRLRWLSLEFSHVSDAGLKKIRGLARLEVLDLSGTAVTDAGLGEIAALPRLETLRLRFRRTTGSRSGEAARPVAPAGVGSLQYHGRRAGLGACRTCPACVSCRCTTPISAMRIWPKSEGSRALSPWTSAIHA